uniref:C2H2-type domain-containing protein n=1 Tax=Panagrolaimus superbus TaxID=310955 RepID=A0A914YCG3_9BILA
MPPKASRNRDRGTAVKFVVPFFGRPACPKCSQINVVRDYGSVPDCKKHVVNEHDMDFYLCCKYCNFSCEDMKKMNIHIRSCNARDKEEVKNYNNKGPIPKAAKLRRVPNIVTSQPRPESRTSSRSPPQQQNSSSAPRTYQRAPRPVSGSPVGQRTRSRSRSISATAPQQPSRQTSREPSAEIVAQTASPTPQNQQPSLQPIQEEEEVREMNGLQRKLQQYNNQTVY